MIIFSRPTSFLEVVLAGPVTTTELPIVANWIDVLTADQSVSAYGESDLATAGSTGVQVVGPPAQGHTRTLKSMTIYNGDSTGATATVRYNNGGTTRILVKTLLSVGDTLEYVE